MIRKSFAPVVVKFQNHSNDIEKDYRLRRDANGNCIYLEVGEHSVSEYVKSFEKGCSLSSLLQRCSLMNARDIFLSVNQTEPGKELDLSSVPKDLTDAFISLNDIKLKHPDLMKRVSSGESIKDIINSFVNKSNKEVSANGEAEPSNE